MSKTLDLVGLLALTMARQASPADLPNPTELGVLVEPESVHRRRSLFCAQYDLCLDAAFRRGWRSWTCDQCGLFQHARGFRAEDAEHAFSARPGA